MIQKYTEKNIEGQRRRYKKISEELIKIQRYTEVIHKDKVGDTEELRRIYKDKVGYRRKQKDKVRDTEELRRRYYRIQKITTVKKYLS